MNEKIKNCLGITIIIILIVFAFSMVSFVKFYSKSIEPSSFRSFSASGEGKVVAIPDMAQFTFSVITEGGKDIANLQKENTEKVNKAIEFLKTNNIEAKDIKTQSYNLTPRYQYFRPPENGGPVPPPKIVGYTVNQNVLVKIRDFEKIGDTLSGVMQNGANSVSQLFFTIDDPTNLQNQARHEAIEKAKEKAKETAKAAGFRLGKLLSIQEGGFTPIPQIYRAEALGKATALDESTTPIIEPGSQEITVNITLTYEIK